MKFKKNNNNYHKTLNDYVTFLKKKKVYNAKNRFFYENNIEKLSNWTGSDFIKTSRWFQNIRKKNKAKVKTIHLEKMKHWTYDKKRGVIKHNSGEFFKVEGKRILNSQREVQKWDQPFMTQIGFKGGIIGLVRANINNIPPSR